MCWKWGERRVMYQEHAHWKHMQDNTFLPCSAPFFIWKITRTNEKIFGQSDFSPYAGQGLSCLWLAFMVLWCDDSNESKPKRAGPQSVCITIHSLHIFFLCFDACPMQARDYLVSDWLSMVLWCDDSNESKPKRPGPQSVCITNHSLHIFFLCFDVFHELHTRGYTW